MFLKKGCFECNKKIRDFVSHRLSEKEKLILDEISKNDGNRCITSFVSLVCEKYGFSKTCVWYNLRKMKDSGLIVFGNSNERGMKARMTLLGLLVEENKMNNVRDIYEKWSLEK
jgi:predicted transcriptional regulator